MTRVPLEHVGPLNFNRLEERDPSMGSGFHTLSRTRWGKKRTSESQGRDSRKTTCAKAKSSSVTGREETCERSTNEKKGEGSEGGNKMGKGQGGKLPGLEVGVVSTWECGLAYPRTGWGPKS